MIYYILISVFVIGIVALFVWYMLQPAYIIRKGERLNPDGSKAIVYDGNDPKHFPEWGKKDFKKAGLIP